jgi:hypothetical protein
LYLSSIRISYQQLQHVANCSDPHTEDVTKNKWNFTSTLQLSSNCLLLCLDSWIIVLFLLLFILIFLLKIAAFWVVAPCSLALQPRQQPSSFSLSWEPQIILNNSGCSVIFKSEVLYYILKLTQCLERIIQSYSITEVLATLRRKLIVLQVQELKCLVHCQAFAELWKSIYKDAYTVPFQWQSETLRFILLTILHNTKLCDIQCISYNEL